MVKQSFLITNDYPAQSSSSENRGVEIEKGCPEKNASTLSDCGWSDQCVLQFFASRPELFTTSRAAAAAGYVDTILYIYSPNYCHKLWPLARQ